MSDNKTTFKNKTVLVTGGTGSFGEAVVAHLLAHDPKMVIVYSRDEKKQFDIRNRFNHDKLRLIIGDVRDSRALERAMHGVDMVFHAAALKYVPNCEFFPVEALMTNSLGTHNVIEAAINGGIKNVVVLSTDKAVYPINTMGMTKALAEKIMIAASIEKRGATDLCGTRYGNVMYTRGSVIPFFIERMKHKKPLTLTNGGMTRFMMSLDEAIDLVLFALVNGKSGEIYVRKAPAATMTDLIQALAELFKYKKGVVEVGARPGEKLHETLISTEELSRTEDIGDYYKIIPELAKMDYKEHNFGGLAAHNISAEGYTSANTARLTVKEIKKLLLALPEIRKELSLLKKGRFYHE
ncbi:MAG: polysaccharide biosynthesis protein [Candidatus Yanofskybacteria bacterium]|nr:polysaccharide biosynthesis protein [Candidatus Yanofskybacteria bacterium]